MEEHSGRCRTSSDTATPTSPPRSTRIWCPDSSRPPSTAYPLAGARLRRGRPKRAKRSVLVGGDLSAPKGESTAPQEFFRGTGPLPWLRGRVSRHRHSRCGPHVPFPDGAEPFASSSSTSTPSSTASTCCSASMARAQLNGDDGLSRAGERRVPSCVGSLPVGFGNAPTRRTAASRAATIQWLT